MKLTRKKIRSLINEMFDASYDLESSIRVALSVVPLTPKELYEELTMDPMYGDQIQSDFAEELSDTIGEMIRRGDLSVNSQTGELANVLY